MLAALVSILRPPDRYFSVREQFHKACIRVCSPPPSLLIFVRARSHEHGYGSKNLQARVSGVRAKKKEKKKRKKRAEEKRWIITRRVHVSFFEREACFFFLFSFFFIDSAPVNLHFRRPFFSLFHSERKGENRLAGNQRLFKENEPIPEIQTRRTNRERARACVKSRRSCRKPCNVWRLLTLELSTEKFSSRQSERNRKLFIIQFLLYNTIGHASFCLCSISWRSIRYLQTTLIY